MILKPSIAKEVGEALIDAAQNFEETKVPQTVVIINSNIAVALPLDEHSSTEEYKIIATVL